MFCFFFEILLVRTWTNLSEMRIFLEGVQVILMTITEMKASLRRSMGTATFGKEQGQAAGLSSEFTFHVLRAPWVSSALPAMRPEARCSSLGWEQTHRTRVKLHAKIVVMRKSMLWVYRTSSMVQECREVSHITWAAALFVCFSTKIGYQSRGVEFVAETQVFVFIFNSFYNCYPSSFPATHCFPYVEPHEGVKVHESWTH